MKTSDGPCVEKIPSPYGSSESLEIDPTRSLPLGIVEDLYNKTLTKERWARMESVCKLRTASLTCVLENIYDSGNTAAVLRSAEAFGMLEVFHVLSATGQKFSQRVTKGADKWLLQHKFRDSTECFQKVRQRGFQLVVTDLGPGTIPIDQVDFSRPSAIVFGNERSGVSQVAKEMADVRMTIPMLGFVESFNISVAASLCFFEARRQRRERWGLEELTAAEQRQLLVRYAVESHPSLVTSLF